MATQIFGQNFGQNFGHHTATQISCERRTLAFRRAAQQRRVVARLAPRRGEKIEMYLDRNVLSRSASHLFHYSRDMDLRAVRKGQSFFFWRFQAVDIIPQGKRPSATGVKIFRKNFKRPENRLDHADFGDFFRRKIDKIR